MIAALALLAAALVTVTLTGFLLLAASEQRIAHNLLASTQALVLAESGLEVAVVRLNSGEPVGELHATLGAGHHTVRVEMLDANHALVTAIGEVDGATRTVSNVAAREPSGRWQLGAQFKDVSP